jgi:hypothetical protein
LFQSLPAHFALHEIGAKILNTMDSPAAVLLVSDPSLSYYSPGLRLRHQGSSPDLAPLHSHSRGINLDYHPDLSKYVSRSAAIAQNNELGGEVPSGWPKRLVGPLTWTSADSGVKHDVVYELSVREKGEIDDALKHFKGLRH